MTYVDYKVGDHIRITVNKDTPTIAKRLRYVDQGFNYTRTKKVIIKVDIKEIIQEKRKQKTITDFLHIKYIVLSRPHRSVF